jgi:hypothetical protein
LTLLDSQLLQQRLRLLQVECIEAFSKPAIHSRKKTAGFFPLLLITPKPCHAHRRAQFPGLRLLLARNNEGTLEVRLGFRGIRLWRPQSDFAGDAIDFGLVPSFLGRFDRGYCFADATPSIVESSKLRIGRSQMARKGRAPYCCPDCAQPGYLGTYRWDCVR